VIPPKFPPILSADYCTHTHTHTHTHTRTLGQNKILLLFHYIVLQNGKVYHRGFEALNWIREIASRRSSNDEEVGVFKGTGHGPFDVVR
jgi:hypothetical protein